MIPEQKAAERLGAVLHEALYPRVLSEDYCRTIAAKLLARHEFVQAVIADYTSDPERIPDRDVVLKRQQSARFDDYDFWLEQQHYHEQGAREAAHHVSRIRAAAGTLSQLVDRDARGIAEDEDREKQERQQERAVSEAPRLGGAA